MNYYLNWLEETRSAYLYGVMAEHETNILHKKLFLDLEKSAKAQAQLWAEKLAASGVKSTPFKPDLRTKIISWMVKAFGTDNVHNILSAMKIRGMSLFNQFHSEHRHTTLNSVSNLRAAVFGINDGLVSNMSLILGMIGANASAHTILVAATAGLIAGACSMGAGEYISVKSQREVFEHQIELERRELEEYPEEEMEELTLIYEAKGIPKEEARKLSKLMIENPKTGLDTLAREELGLNPQDLVSPIGAMISSFLFFAIGAFIPLVPFLFSGGISNLYVSLALTAFTLFLIGMILSLFNNKNAFLQGLRMLVVGVLAGLITFLVGQLFKI